MSNSGFKAYTDLEQYYVDSGVATGTTKTNSISDPDYIAPVYDINYCPLPSAPATPSPTVSVTPSITPSVTPTVTPTISVTPSISVSISVTPTISVTPSITPTISATPSISVTPSITPTISLTPSITPSVPTTYYYYSADRYECTGGYCNYIETINIANPTQVTIDAGKFYFDNINCYIFSVINEIPQSVALITNLSSGTKNCTSLCSIIC
jgi:hypothetical protein